MNISVKNWDLENTDKQLDLPEFIFNYPVREDIVAQVIRWQLARKRSGNASTKTRSDVSGTTRKPWAQKETGKARQGSLRSPHFRGGGVVFGPHPRSYDFKLNKKVRTIGLFSALSDRFMDDNIIVIDSFDKVFLRTKDFADWKDKNKLKSALFIGDIDSRSFNNLVNFNRLDVEGINVLSLIKHEKIIFDLESIEYFISLFDFDSIQEFEEEKISV